MHCLICNAILTDDEATLKDVDTGAYLDTCSACMDEDLSDYEEFDDNVLYEKDSTSLGSVVFTQLYDDDGNKVLDSDEF